MVSVANIPLVSDDLDKAWQSVTDFNLASVQFAEPHYDLSCGDFSSANDSGLDDEFSALREGSRDNSIGSYLFPELPESGSASNNASKMYSRRYPSPSSFQEAATEANNKTEDASDMSAFASVLHTCSNLHQIYESLRNSGVPVEARNWALSNQLQSILQSLDAAGDVIIGVTGTNVWTMCQDNTASTALAPAVPVLIVATIFKLLDICNILTKSSTPSLQSLNHVQLLKRIEFNLMQACTALVHIQSIDASLAVLAQQALSTAARMHRDIKSAMERLPAELGW